MWMLGLPAREPGKFSPFIAEESVTFFTSETGIDDLRRGAAISPELQAFPVHGWAALQATLLSCKAAGCRRVVFDPVANTSRFSKIENVILWVHQILTGQRTGRSHLN
ncbi:MAG: hypothetical protein IT452_04295 [Planctomycetia bacterium]|nr:hypothetical protein [Planctomycetia bacterium]